MKLPWSRLGVEIIKLFISSVGLVLVVLGIPITLFQVYWVVMLGIGLILIARLFGFFAERP
ncbi:MAG: hypothetical protein D6736_15210 [Nitrospinota bacterium]|nr:MAG: hypothetical protein D6736_15210 [Nitrospinota bacterium]